MTERWASFDCYGTLIDWNAGLRAELVRLFGDERADDLLERYHELEPRLEADGSRSYSSVLTLALAQLAREEGTTLPVGETDALVRSLPSWDPFPEVPAALAGVRERGWRLAILSNSDHDLISASIERIGVPFDLVVVAEDVGAYKPAHAHWLRFRAETAAETGRHVHVAASVLHDITPASELGVTTVWVNRLGEKAAPRPAREIPDLTPLPDVLDELVPP